MSYYDQKVLNALEKIGNVLTRIAVALEDSDRSDNNAGVSND